MEQYIVVFIDSVDLWVVVDTRNKHCVDEFHSKQRADILAETLNNNHNKYPLDGDLVMYVGMSGHDEWSLDLTNQELYKVYSDEFGDFFIDDDIKEEVMIYSKGIHGISDRIEYFKKVTA